MLTKNKNIPNVVTSLHFDKMRKNTVSKLEHVISLTININSHKFTPINYEITNTRVSSSKTILMYLTLFCIKRYVQRDFNFKYGSKITKSINAHCIYDIICACTFSQLNLLSHDLPKQLKNKKTKYYKLIDRTVCLVTRGVYLNTRKKTKTFVRQRIFNFIFVC